MTDNKEIIKTHGQQIEKSVVKDALYETTLPDDGERLVVGAKQTVEGQPDDAGIEVVSLAGLPLSPEGNIMYKGAFLDPTLKAILVDPMIPADFEGGKGFKGLRAGEAIPDALLSRRFGKEVPFGIALDDEGKLIIENKKPEERFDVLRMKPDAGPADQIDVEIAEDTLPKVTAEEPSETSIAAESAQRVLGVEKATEAAVETELSPEEHAELVEEFKEDAGEIVAENLVLVEGEPRDAEEEIEIGQEDTTVEVQAEPEALDNAAIIEKIGESKRLYEQQVDDILQDVVAQGRTAAGTITDGAGEAHRRLKSNLGNVEEGAMLLVRIASRVESGDDDPGYIRRALAGALDTLHQSSSQLRNAGQAVFDIRRHAGGMVETFEESAHTLKKKDAQFTEGVSRTLGDFEGPKDSLEVPVFDAQNTVRALNQVKESASDMVVGLRKAEDATVSYVTRLGSAINQLDAVTSQVGRGRLETNDLRRLARMLNEISEDRDAIRNLAQAGEQASQLKQAVVTLGQDR